MKTQKLENYTDKLQELSFTEKKKIEGGWWVYYNEKGVSKRKWVNN